jgi:serpin B
MRHSHVALIALLSLIPSKASAQDVPASQLSDLLRANESFGRRLLAELHAGAVQKNLVISPLGVSISFAPIRDASFDPATLNEIDKVFGWESVKNIDVSSKMLLARFDEGSTKTSTRFLFRDTASVAPDFLKRLKRYFGVEVQAVDSAASQEQILSQGQDPSFVPPRLEGERHNAFWIVNRTDLDARWHGNTFAIVRPRVDSFMLASGAKEQTPVLVSEVAKYPHVKTADFDAIRLNCGDAYILIVLPQPGKDIRDFEKSLAEGQILTDSNFPQEIGDVQLPEFHVQYEANLRPTLEKMGMNRVFVDIGSLRRISAQGAMLLGISQKVDMKLDQGGIHAHAFTIGGGVIGGVMSWSVPPFHMVVNRPFVFFIRDIYTDSLLFAGAVVNPNKN